MPIDFFNECVLPAPDIFEQRDDDIHRTREATRARDLRLDLNVCIVIYYYTFANTYYLLFVMISYFMFSAVVHIEHKQVKIKHSVFFGPKIRKLTVSTWDYDWLLRSCNILGLHLSCPHFKVNFGVSFEARFHVFGFHPFCLYFNAPYYMF